MFSLTKFMKNTIQNISIAIILLFSLSFFACNKEDKLAPIIKLTGDTIVNIDLNSVYTDKGATATDDKDGDITKSIFVKNEVNVNKVGTYNVMFSVSDKAGNVSPVLTRKVNVNNGSSKYIGNYFAKNYTLFPAIDSLFYNTSITIDSTLNNRLFFNVFGDSIPKNVFFIINNDQVEIPYQKITNPISSKEYTFQGYGSINTTTSEIKINYFKGLDDVVYTCKSVFNKQ